MKHLNSVSWKDDGSCEKWLLKETRFLSTSIYSEDSLVCLVPSQGSTQCWTGTRAEIMSSQLLCLGKGCMRSIRCLHNIHFKEESENIHRTLFTDFKICFFSTDFRKNPFEIIPAWMLRLFLSFCLTGEFSKQFKKEKKRKWWVFHY